MLSDYKLTVITCNNGKEAVDYIEKDMPDMVLMDLKMPVMNGYEAIEIIRERHGDELLVVAVTASVFHDEVKMILKKGFNEIIRKPFKIETLDRFLARHSKISLIFEEADGNQESMREKIDITTIDKQLLKNIKDAAELGDIDLIITIINDSNELPSQFKSYIRHLCDNFDIEGLLNAVGK